MRILVVGGAGYIGSMLVPRLAERGYAVEVADLLWFGNHLPAETPVRRMDANALTKTDLAGFDQVIFLGGLSNDPMAEYSPARNFHENGATPAYLAWLAKQAGVKRFIYGGSCSVYGYTVNAFCDETHPAECAFPYGISKLIGEYGVMQQADPGFSVIAFRQGTVSGWSPRMRFDLIVNTMFKTAVSENMIRVNNPALWRPVLTVRDAVTAYARAVEAPLSISGVFNVASGNYTVGEVADIVYEGVGKHLNLKPRMDILQIQDLRSYKVSFTKVEEQLSFKPSYSIAAIVEELAGRVTEFGDFSNPAFYNIATFKAVETAMADA